MQSPKTTHSHRRSMCCGFSKGCRLSWRFPSRNMTTTKHRRAQVFRQRPRHCRETKCARLAWCHRNRVPVRIVNPYRMLMFRTLSSKLLIIGGFATKRHARLRCKRPSLIVAWGREMEGAEENPDYPMNSAGQIRTGRDIL